MSDELSPEANELLSLAVSTGGASDADRARVRSKIGVALAAGAAAGAASAGGAAAAAGGAAKASGLGLAGMGFGAVAIKGLAVIAVVGGVVGVSSWQSSTSNTSDAEPRAVSASEGRHSRDGTLAGDVAGDLTASELGAGDLSAGELGAGELSADDLAAGVLAGDLTGEPSTDDLAGVLAAGDLSAHDVTNVTATASAPHANAAPRAPSSGTASTNAVTPDARPQTQPASASATATLGGPAQPQGSAPEMPALTHSLDDELTLLRAAQRARASGDLQQAIRLLASHRTRFPNGMLAAERDGATVLALCEAGQVASARAAAQAFAVDHPGSPLGQRVLAACQP